MLKILPGTLLALILCSGGGLVALVHLTAPTTAPNSSALANTARPHEGFYWRHSMWLADARTYANMLVYLLRPEINHAGTNPVVNG